MKTYKIKPPTYLLIAILVAIALHFIFPVMNIIPLPWTLLGIIPLAFGLVINIRADQVFHKAKTPVCPFGTASSLVTDDVYHLTRNPMYLGFVLILLGIAVLLGSLAPYVSVLAFTFLLDSMFIRVEEQKMSTQFGLAWQAYKSQTRRWL